MNGLENHRNFLKGHLWDQWDALERDQQKGLPVPLPQKPYGGDETFVDLVAQKDFTVGSIPLINALERRRSCRKYTGESLNLEELSFLIWAVQGITGDSEGRRTAPSAGGRHPFETYLAINNVEGVKPGLYRYLPMEHRLLIMGRSEGLDMKVVEACKGQKFVAKGAVVFMWTALPYRAEWRYSLIAHKMVAIDAGHLCQNLYLACQSIDAGACAIGKYKQDKMDALLEVDGVDEFAVYAAVVGKV
ncbi:MAG: SagB/ThcOx family dehydrogenase [Bacillota bacterium]|nr:SagB/ThcOx family dehydrogenase [Bacillota bacterium]MDD3298457.1 SagB/ThcOx family dehydrogenase [Bacillota bacterium]MDD3850778.1 SagB/ThcOx family dehydrogenase [Bacillota bacterium]MDD4707307.1 SagB/ThcOx family dehydrogenase [Bacillota bacterium]